MLATSADFHWNIVRTELTLLKCTGARFFVYSRKFFAMLHC